MKKLSLLELGETNIYNPAQVIKQTISLAKKADNLGYYRLWLGEHHGAGVAWSNPDVLLSSLACQTNSIKIGSGGVLLPLNSPLRVAQNYKLLAAMYPKRIDLGIGRGGALDYIARELLNGISLNENFKRHPERIKKTINFLSQDLRFISETNYFEPISLEEPSPDVWILGSSSSSTEFALLENANYSFSLIHSNKQSSNDFLSFQNNAEKKLNTNLLISTVCGRDKKEYSKVMDEYKNDFIKINVFGDKNECFDKINDLFEKFKVQEIMIYFISGDYKNKIYCYETFSELFELREISISKQKTKQDG
jgi:luciferase family oxidoreductase group 1